MEPVSLAAAAVSFVTPYLVHLGKDAAGSAAKEAGKSVWGWIKGNLTSPAGAEVVADAEAAPDKPESAQALQAALTKALTIDPGAAKALADLLKANNVPLPSQSSNITGSNNIVGQANGGSSVSINRR